MSFLQKIGAAVVAISSAAAATYTKHSLTLAKSGEQYLEREERGSLIKRIALVAFAPITALSIQHPYTRTHHREFVARLPSLESVLRADEAEMDRDSLYLSCESRVCSTIQDRKDILSGNYVLAGEGVVYIMPNKKSEKQAIVKDDMQI